MIKKIGFMLALVAAVSMLSMPVLASESTVAPTESTVPQESTLASIPTETASAPATAYTVSTESTRAYALINGAYLSLEISYSRGTEIVATPQSDGYALLADGTYLLLSDLAAKPVESATPNPTIVPLDTPQKSSGLIVLIFIFLVCLVGSGIAGYAIRGVVEKKRWMQDPYRFDNLLSAEKATSDIEKPSEEPKEKKRTVLDKYLDKRKEPREPKPTKPKPEKVAKTKPAPKVDASYLIGGKDEAGRTYYYEPEEIDPEGNPFWLDDNGGKHYYE